MITTATYHDPWGDVPLALVAFKTTRRGQKVVRWRWTGLPSLSFSSADAALAYARRRQDVTLHSEA